MGGGELAAVFEGLAGDAEQAGGDIAESIAKFTETTADTEDANVERILTADAQNARSVAAIGKEAGSDAGALGPSGGWTGAGYVESSSPEEEAAYEAIRANSGDVPKIAENTGIGEDVIAQVKNHLFMTEHDVPIGPNEVAHGYFTPSGAIASLWTKAEQGSLSPAEFDQLRSLLAHEYVESRLMESGMPYRSADPEAWENGDQVFNPPHFGAHEVAPLGGNGSLRHWPSLGLTPPDVPIAQDLSNLEEIVSAAREGLGL